MEQGEGKDSERAFYVAAAAVVYMVVVVAVWSLLLVL